LPKVNLIRIVFLFVLVLGFIFGVVKLFLLRFEAGDVYPTYSSLRSDPLGSRAFYSSLENMNDNRVSRNYLTLRDLKFEDHTALFYTGVAAFDAESVSAEWLKVFERLTRNGGRMILSFLPIEKKPADWRMSTCVEPEGEVDNTEKGSRRDVHDDSEKPGENDENKSRTTPGRQIQDTSGKCVSLKEQWGLTFAFAEEPAEKADHFSDDLSQNHGIGLPQTISWHTALYFDELDGLWRVIYTANGRPVVIERSYGKGSLVLSADSFFLSNEAMRSERHPELLAWTLGESANVVFDETHFGIFKQPGVLGLIRKYRFQWFLFTVAVIALLFIWKNSDYIGPPPKQSQSQPGRDVSSDRDSTQGLISLLRRNIPARQLLQICTREWERSIQSQNRLRNDKLRQVKSALQMVETQSPKSIDPVLGYRRISKIISKGRRHE
jgi:hypothetical protein